MPKKRLNKLDKLENDMNELEVNLDSIELQFDETTKKEYIEHKIASNITIEDISKLYKDFDDSFHFNPNTPEGLALNRLSFLIKLIITHLEGKEKKENERKRK